MFYKKPKVVTHSGTFHPDDITAVAILSLYLDKPIKIIRSRDPKIWATADYIFDVGGEYNPEKNQFDHHQESFTMKRENGITYSSAGLAWKHFGEKVAGSHDVWKKIEEKIIQPFDANDNGIEISKNNFEGVQEYSFGDYLHSFNNTWHEKDRDSLKAFTFAVEEAKKMLQREIQRTKDSLLAEKYVQEIYEKSDDKRLIIFDEVYSWKKVIERHPEPLIVILQTPESGIWNAYTVPIFGSKFERRIYFPQSWAGKNGKDLAEITGVPDATFCHKGKFIAAAKSKDGAIALAKLALSAHKV